MTTTTTTAAAAAAFVTTSVVFPALSPAASSSTAPAHVRHASVLRIRQPSYWPRPLQLHPGVVVPRSSRLARQTYPLCSLTPPSSSSSSDDDDNNNNDTVSSSSQSSPSETSSSTTAPAMSKTEELALKLGQTKETMEERQTTILRESKLTNRRKIANVTICTLIAVTLFLSEKLNPNSGANLLRYLEDSSVDASVMGTNGQPTLVEFGAPWCQTCQDMAKHVFALRNEFDNRVNFVIVDGDDAKYADLLDQFEVDGLPQFSFVDGNGKDVGDFIGFVPEYVLRENIEALLQGKSSLPHQGISIKLLEQELASKMTKE